MESCSVGGQAVRYAAEDISGLVFPLCKQCRVYTCFGRKKKKHRFHKYFYFYVSDSTNTIPSSPFPQPTPSSQHFQPGLKSFQGAELVELPLFTQQTEGFSRGSGGAGMPTLHMICVLLFFPLSSGLAKPKTAQVLCSRWDIGQ